IPIACALMTNQYANSEGESRIHTLIPLSSTVLKIKGMSKSASLKQSGPKLQMRRNVSQAKVSCQGKEWDGWRAVGLPALSFFQHEKDRAAIPLLTFRDDYFLVSLKSPFLLS